MLVSQRIDVEAFVLARRRGVHRMLPFFIVEVLSDYTPARFTWR
jgi:hypothetical protein